MSEPTVAIGEDRTLPAVVYALYLLGFATGALTTLAGVVVAYVQLGTASPAVRTHYDFLIRTAWMFFAWALIALALCVVGGVLSIVLIGIPILLAGIAVFALLGVWFAVRCIVGVIYLARGQPYPRPMSWLA